MSESKEPKLEIRITPQKMYKVLSNFLEEPEAKSIILDLLMEMDGQPLLMFEPEAATEEALTEDADEDQDDPAPRVTVKAPKLKPQAKVRTSSKRVNFNVFGGAAEPLGDGVPTNDDT